MAQVKPIPEGYHAVSPYLIVNDGVRAIEFYRKVFEGKERMRMMRPDGRVGHAEVAIGDSVVMLADENLEFGAKSPQTIGGTPVTISVYVPDVDATIQKAVAAGARLVRPVANQFYGDRVGGIIDPFGHSWHVATHVEDVTPEEMVRREAALH
jgi:PhnB protein